MVKQRDGYASNDQLTGVGMEAVVGCYVQFLKMTELERFLCTNDVVWNILLGNGNFFTVDTLLCWITFLDNNTQSRAGDALLKTSWKQIQYCGLERRKLTFQIAMEPECSINSEGQYLKFLS